jgi:hypothetical protein
MTPAVWTELAQLLDAYDSDFKVVIASTTAWSGQLRLTLTNPDDAPSRSITFYAVAGASPEEVARAVLDDARRWLAENPPPLPVPDWMR